MADAPVLPTPITASPPAPQRTDESSVYVPKADAFVNYIGGLDEQYNSTSTNVYNNAVSAYDSASESIAASVLAVAAAGAELWVSGQSYAIGEAAISTIDFQAYRANEATSGSTDPSASASWTLVTYGAPGPDGQIEIVATGALANGDKVIINADGTVSVITQSATTVTVGTPVQFESGTTGESSATYDIANNRIVIAYVDTGNSSRGTAVVGTVVGTAISFGTPVVFESGINITYISACYDSANSKVVIAYRGPSPNSYGLAIVGTVSGTSISFGSAATFKSAQSDWVSACYDSTNSKVVIAFSASSLGQAVVGTVSGTSISFGTAVTFESASERRNSICYDSANGKVVVAYVDAGNGNFGTAAVGTVSGTSISFGTPVVFESAATDNSISAVYDSTNGKVVIAYQDNGNSNYGTAIVGTVSGTSISFGVAAVFESATTTTISAAYDSLAQKVVITYTDGGNSSYGTGIRGTVSGTSISFDTAIVFVSASTAGGVSSTFNGGTDKNVVIAYVNSTGYAVVWSSETTNLTSGNFIGISNAAYADGETATIQVIGAKDDAQSGLTAGQSYYVQRDNTLSLTPGSPSVYAGTAISTTEIIVKG